MDIETETEAPTTDAALTEGVDETPELVEAEAAEVTPEQAAEARRAVRLKAAEEAEQGAARARAARAQKLAEAEEVAQRRAWMADRDRVAQEKRELAEERERVRTALRQGGPDALKALGLDYTKLTQEFLEEQSPDAQVRRLAKQLEELRAEREAEKAEAEQSRRQQSERSQLDNAIRMLDGVAEQFPHAFDLPRNLQAAGIQRAKAELEERLGRAPTYAEVFTRLDREASALFTEAEKRRALRARPLPSDGETERDAALSANQGNSPRTLSNQLAGTKASKKPPLTDEELDRQLAAELRESLRKDFAGSR